MTTMTITIERTPRTFRIGTDTLQVEELSITLPFARKPCNLSKLGGDQPETILVTETREMSTAEFDEFAANLLRSRDWLDGKGGTTQVGTLCVEVCAPGRPYLYINPEGSNYARYVARLG
ncbi:hypothetical protein [Rhodoferax sp.]|uniref:hypothetical protein n=1 Tax=Rhodoferax sp. TaxID=50421 RepID=UPI001A0DE32F|nr:hypothetical protein [Rhodoferax sp.]MBE0474893.1 hypothetical protein [Rhodoferax sp.]